MAQVRRQARNPSPPPRQIPQLPGAIRFRPPSSTNIRRSESFQVNNLPPYAGSPIRPIHHPPPPPPRTGQTGVFHSSNNMKYDALTGLFINNNTTTTNNNNENYQQSYIISSPVNQLTHHERRLPPPPPPQSSENIYTLQQYQHDPSILNNNEAEESVVIPTAIDDDGLPVVSMDRSHLPVYARFPFDVTFIPQSMDTNVEDNVHKLRLRLIDSELDRQRRSTDEYIKRTHEQLSLPSPKPTENYLHHIRPSNNFIYQRVTPKILSRQTSVSPLSIETPMTSRNLSRLSRDRIGLENDPQGNLNIERDLELRRIQDSLSSGRRPNQQLMISNYLYDPRLHLQPVNEERQYTSSNMDDIIDSMARRHLSYRRLDAAVDRQRRGNGNYGQYFEPPAIGRRPSLRNQPRNDDLFFTNSTSSSHFEHDFIGANPNDLNQLPRSRIDYYNRSHPDLDGLSMNNIIRTSSYPRLPPISPGIDSNRLVRSQNQSHSALYQAKHSPHTHENYQQSVPLNLPDHSEHLIELPSDIFLTSRTEQIGSSQHHHHHHYHQTRKTKQRAVSRDKSDGLADSESDESDGEHNSSIAKRRHKSKQEKKSENGQHGFFTEGHPQQQKNKPKFHRNLFKKAAVGILFYYVLKHRAAKNRLNRPSQTLSATIHKIRIQEIMVALHRVYLEPDGPIYNALIQAITSSIELKDALDPLAKYYAQAIDVIGDALKNVISRIVDFMPRDGVLGTAQHSAVAALIQDGNAFPENYFWQCEKEILEFNKSKVINITKQRAMLLLIGIFIFRALITTLLMKPVKYRLMLGQLTNNQLASLKVLASVFFYVGRRAAKSIPQILRIPHEWELSLYRDIDIEPIIQHSEIKSILTTCELSLRVWCEEYIRRIDSSFGKELRT